MRLIGASISFDRVHRIHPDTYHQSTPLRESPLCFSTSVAFVLQYFGPQVPPPAPLRPVHLTFIIMYRMPATYKSSTEAERHPCNRVHYPPHTHLKLNPHTNTNVHLRWTSSSSTRRFSRCSSARPRHTTVVHATSPLTTATPYGSNPPLSRRACATLR